MAEDWKPMTTLSEAFDHVVYWWDRLTGRPEPVVGFPAPAIRGVPAGTVVPVPRELLGLPLLSETLLGQVCGFGADFMPGTRQALSTVTAHHANGDWWHKPCASWVEQGEPCPVCGCDPFNTQPFELADNESFVDPISGRSWIWTAGEFIRTPDADVPPAGER